MCDTCVTQSGSLDTAQSIRDPSISQQIFFKSVHEGLPLQDVGPERTRRHSLNEYASVTCVPMGNPWDVSACQLCRAVWPAALYPFGPVIFTPKPQQGLIFFPFIITYITH